MNTKKSLKGMNKYQLVEYIIVQCKERGIPIEPEIYDLICVELHDYIAKKFHPELKPILNVSPSNASKKPFWKETIGLSINA